MTIDGYFDDCIEKLKECLADPRNRRSIETTVAALKRLKARGKNKAIIVGNGGSAAIAEHVAVDFTKNAGLKAMAFSGTPLLTTMANDYGYEKVFEKCIERFGEPGDILIAISSGGRSRNILNACRAARARKMSIVTLSGFKGDNPLKKVGDWNIWVDSRAYGYVEVLHGFILHYINDAIIGRAEYVIR
jgi:phosphoheptose isomerase